ncbi:MAG: hypothetical protein Q9170_003989 [Blastenia crenularia]
MAVTHRESPLPFFRHDIGPRLKPRTRHLLETYSGIKPEDVILHLHEIRDRAWSFQKYPCIGQWVFLLPRMPSLPWYKDILDRIKAGSSILDIGCCFAQDLRFLAADGAPTANMYATDITPDFWGLSYDLFRDKAFFDARFITADVLGSMPWLGQLETNIDIFLVNQVFHLFDAARQLVMAKNIVALSQSNSWVVGWQIGSINGAALPVRTETGGETGSAGSDTKLFHNDATWRELWQQVGQETNTEWSVETRMQALSEWGYEKEDTNWMGRGAIGFEFICRRVV